MTAAPSVIDIYEPCICDTSRSGNLADFLSKRYKGVTVRVHDLASPQGEVPMPVSLLRRLEESDGDCLPAMVIDGELVAEGGLPTLIQAVQTVEEGLVLNGADCACIPGCCG